MNKKGEMTVEAAFIIPIILMIVFLFVYVIFAVHDRAVILMKADLMLEKATAPFLEEKKKGSDDATDSDKEIQDGLFIYTINQYEVIKNGFFYTVNIDYNQIIYAFQRMILSIIMSILTSLTDSAAVWYKYKVAQGNHTVAV